MIEHNKTIIINIQYSVLLRLRHSNCYYAHNYTLMYCAGKHITKEMGILLKRFENVYIFLYIQPKRF